MIPRLVKSLVVLRDQINKAHPARSKVTDGWIGDAKHAARKSDHNPDANGAVRALDITHDPAHGVDTWKLAEALRVSRDPRISYVISHGKIFSSTVSPWEWRKYTGSNPHTSHVHISVRESHQDIETPWAIKGRTAAPSPAVPPPRGVTAEMRGRMARAIIDYEAKRDGAGNLAIHHPGDGSYEVAGINSTHHASSAAELAKLVRAGKHKEAEAAAAAWILDYTKIAAGWTTDAGVEFMLRDTVHHRGPTGAAHILQMAAGVTVDGEVGPRTRAAVAAAKPLELLDKIRAAREAYEIKKYGRRERYWMGFQNRWNKSLAQSKAFHRETGGVAVAVGTAAGGVVVAGGTAVAIDQGVSALEILAWIGGLSLSVIVAVIIIYRLVKGHFPWTGEASPALLPHSPQNSVPSLEQLSAAQLELQSAALREAPSQPRSGSKKPRKRSAKPSPKTRKRPTNSRRSKQPAAKKSSPKRKSASRS